MGEVQGEEGKIEAIKRNAPHHLDGAGLFFVLVRTGLRTPNRIADEMTPVVSRASYVTEMESGLGFHPLSVLTMARIPGLLLSCR